VQLENIIVRGKDQPSAGGKVDGTNPKWIFNLKTFGEMAIITRH
jgi:hypothetical protein